GTCGSGAMDDAYFTVSSSTCNVGVEAHVDFGTSDPTTRGASVTATVGGTSYPLATTGCSTTGVWCTKAVIPVSPGVGPVGVNLDWQTTKGSIGTSDCTKSSNAKVCKGSFGMVQRTFAGS